MHITFNFAQEWPILILIGGFISFVIYLVIIGRKNQGNDQGQNQNKEKDQGTPESKT